MGYSRNPITLQKRMAWLEKVMEGEPCVWQVPDGMSVHDFAYKIREALFIGAMYPDEYPKVAAAKRKFRIEVLSSRKVAAVSKGHYGDVMLVDPEEPTATAPTGEKEILGPQTAMSVIEAWIDRKQPQLYFPDAKLSAEDKVALYSWAQKRNLIFFVASEGQLTIQHHDSDLEEYQWRPA